MVRRALRSLVRRLLLPDFPGRALSRLSGPSGRLSVQRRAALEDRYQARCDRLFAGLTVLGGPFAGLRYPAGEAYGSALPPKLLGTYESELHPALDHFRKRDYDTIIDIGFAEGYYLVGLAGWFPRARILGFDISREAHRLCVNLASANGLASQRLQLQTSADAESLAPALAGRSLVVCDCEGFEAQLFAADQIFRWRRADLLIECHDFLVPDLTETLVARLGTTHELEIVPTAAPGAQVALLPWSLRRGFHQDDLVRLVAEGRPTAQTWLVGTARDT